MKQGIQVGQAAPNVTLPDDSGDSVALSSLWQGQPLLVAFLRHFG